MLNNDKDKMELDIQEKLEPKKARLALEILRLVKKPETKDEDFIKVASNVYKGVGEDEVN